jgi:hypothetical protein
LVFVIAIVRGASAVGDEPSSPVLRGTHIIIHYVPVNFMFILGDSPGASGLLSGKPLYVVLLPLVTAIPIDVSVDWHGSL